LALSFIDHAADAFRGFEADPASELTNSHLTAALEALGRIPLIGPEVATALKPVIGQAAYAALLGPVRTWMHRTVASISDESKLRRILLRLLQASLPLYAQIRHGPIEFGKDIAALLEIHGRLVLTLYAVKCGVIDKPKWKESKSELEEMFQVDLPSLHLPADPDDVEGVFVTNGHANVFVEPVIEGWLREQREVFGRKISFMHLDGIVSWVVNDRLINELKLALTEEGIAIVTA
jgi:hypothetical protein